MNLLSRFFRLTVVTSYFCWSFRSFRPYLHGIRQDRKSLKIKNDNLDHFDEKLDLNLKLTKEMHSTLLTAAILQQTIFFNSLDTLAAENGDFNDLSSDLSSKFSIPSLSQLSLPSLPTINLPTMEMPVDSKLLTTTVRSMTDKVSLAPQFATDILSYFRGLNTQLTENGFKIISDGLSKVPLEYAIFGSLVVVVLFADQVQSNGELRKMLEEQEAETMKVTQVMEKHGGSSMKEIENYQMLHKESERLQNEIVKISAQFDEKALEVVDLNDKLNSLIMDVDLSIIDSLKQESILLKEEIQRLNKMGSKQMKQVEDREKAFFVALKEFLLRKELIDEKKANSMKVEEIPVLLGELGKKSDKKAEIKEKSMAESEKLKYEKVIAGLEKTIETMKTAEQDYSKKLSQIQSESSIYKSDITKLEKQLKEVNAKLSAPKATIDPEISKAKITAAVKEAEEKSKEKIVLSQKAAKLAEKKVDTLIADMKTLRNENAKLRELMVKMESDFAKKEKELKKASSTPTSTSTPVIKGDKELVAKLKELEKKISEKDKNLQKVENEWSLKLESAKTVTKNLNQKVASAGEELRKLQIEVKEKEEQENKMRKALEKEKKSRQNTENSIKKAPEVQVEVQDSTTKSKKSETKPTKTATTATGKPKAPTKKEIEDKLFDLGVTELNGKTLKQALKKELVQKLAELEK